MKILIVSQHYRPEPFNVSDVAEGLVCQGHDVTVLTALPNYPEGTIPEDYLHGRRRDEVVEGVRVLRVPIIARGKNLRGLNKLRRVANYVSFPLMSRLTGLAADNEYDCVICFQFSPILMVMPALRIAKTQGIPCLVWSFDLWPEDMLSGGISRSGLPFRIMRSVSKRLYNAADLVAVTSPRFVEYFRNQLGLVDLKMVWLPQFSESMFETVDCSTVKNDATVFTFAGNVGSNQSVETIVEAAALLQNDALRIRIVGSGSRLDSCRHMAMERHLRNIEFLGRLPLKEMPRLYAESDAMLLTLAKSKDDSLVSAYTIPRKFQSYIAAGKPIICAVDGVVSDIITKEGCGMVCAADNPSALANTMRAFSRAEDKRKDAMRIAAKQLYLKEFSRSHFFKELEEILGSLVEGK